jgi:heme/copper-type cytochrome/quinol oxidase subunit 2
MLSPAKKTSKQTNHSVFKFMMMIIIIELLVLLLLLLLLGQFCPRITIPIMVFCMS